MHLTKLYSRNSNGSVQVWWIELEGNTFRQHYGRLDGKIVVKGWSYGEIKNSGKSNESTPEEQAQLEVDALYEKQKKKNYFENIKDIDSGFLEPQLAKPCKEYIDDVDWKAGPIIDDKLNGCISGESLIKTKEFGYITISDIVENKKDCSVESYNFKKSRKEYKKVINFFKNKPLKNNESDWYKITLSDGRVLMATSIHEVYLPDLKCYRKVSELCGTENLMVLSKKSSH